MPVRETSLSLKWPVYDVAPDVEQGCLLVLARKVVIKGIVRAVWPVVKRVAQCFGFWYFSQVVWYSRVLRLRALRRRPPYLKNRKW